jgi:hypothetical protein
MPPRILVLEPDPTRQVFFRAALSSAGHAAQVVGTVDEIVEQLKAGRYKLLLLSPALDREGTEQLVQLTESVPIVKLSVLPDCVIGEQRRGRGSPELPGILEALTRYARFAPARPGQPTDEKLLQDWAEFERQRSS